jgi:putative membrane protein
MNKRFLHYFNLFLKGFGVGAANVIPGVSGGTIALITGIFEELIHSIKSIDIQALRLLISGRFRDFSVKINFFFLLAVFGGAIASIFSLARILEFMFLNYPIYVWAYFFGLILASVWFVGKSVQKWTISVIFLFLTGTVIAGGISYLNPAVPNEDFFYLVLCGMVAVCSMILPGLSGSFVLILLGNYELVAIEAVNQFRLDILFPMFIGIFFGLIAFSHLLSWLIRKFRDNTIAALTGFIFGSLIVLWPWKNEIYRLDATGNPLISNTGDLIVQGYERFLPASFNKEVLIATILVLFGFFSIWAIEVLSRKLPGRREKDTNQNFL